jgi:hypothetical protein
MSCYRRAVAAGPIPCLWRMIRDNLWPANPTLSA